MELGFSRSHIWHDIVPGTRSPYYNAFGTKQYLGTRALSWDEESWYIWHYDSGSVHLESASKSAVYRGCSKRVAIATRSYSTYCSQYVPIIFPNIKYFIIITVYSTFICPCIHTTYCMVRDVRYQGRRPSAGTSWHTRVDAPEVYPYHLEFTSKTQQKSSTLRLTSRSRGHSWTFKAFLMVMPEGQRKRTRSEPEHSRRVLFVFSSELLSGPFLNFFKLGDAEG
jgi:hypothetical protein